MNRPLRIIGILGFAGCAVLAGWWVRARSARPAGANSVSVEIQAAITDPKAFAKNRFTGGLGVVMHMDGALAMIGDVMPGSPAEKAGLREGDCILGVDGVPTAGRTLVQIRESITGFAAGSVSLAIQRNGWENVECVVQRTSWKNLGIPQSRPRPSPAPQASAPQRVPFRIQTPAPFGP